MLRSHLLRDADRPIPTRLDLDDFKGALGTFLLVLLATFPLVIPFLLIDRTALVIRLSNGASLTMLFLAGWMLARYSGGNPWAGGGTLALERWRYLGNTADRAGILVLSPDNARLIDDFLISINSVRGVSCSIIEG